MTKRLAVEALWILGDLEELVAANCKIIAKKCHHGDRHIARVERASGAVCDLLNALRRSSAAYFTTTSFDGLDEASFGADGERVDRPTRLNEEDRPTVGGAVHLWLTFIHQAIRLRNAYFAMLQRPITRDPPKHVRSPVAQVLEKRRPGPRT